LFDKVPVTKIPVTDTGLSSPGCLLFKCHSFRGAFSDCLEESLQLNVSLDILFLRPDDHPLIQQGGDLDNRLKTLFDSLKVPDTASGLGGQPEQDEEPFFVLLQDDRLITEFKVSTDTLLMLPRQRAFDSKDAFLVIDAKLSAECKLASGECPPQPKRTTPMMSRTKREVRIPHNMTRQGRLGNLRGVPRLRF